MKADERKKKIMEATMHIIATNGIETFSVIQVARATKINEALIYRDFGTKDNLLLECYKMIDSNIASLYDNYDFNQDVSTPEKLISVLRDLWYLLFLYLLSSDYRTLFYHMYRDSSHMNNLIQHTIEIKEDYFGYFFDNIRSLFLRCNVNYDSIDWSIAWTYVIDASMLFAKRIINGELDDDAKTIDIIWELISNGAKRRLEELDEA